MSTSKSRLEELKLRTKDKSQHPCGAGVKKLNRKKEKRKNEVIVV